MISFDEAAKIREDHGLAVTTGHDDGGLLGALCPTPKPLISIDSSSEIPTTAEIRVIQQAQDYLIRRHDSDSDIAGIPARRGANTIILCKFDGGWKYLMPSWTMHGFSPSEGQSLPDLLTNSVFSRDDHWKPFFEDVRLLLVLCDELEAAGFDPQTEAVKSLDKNGGEKTHPKQGIFIWGRHLDEMKMDELVDISLGDGKINIVAVVAGRDLSEFTTAADMNGVIRYERQIPLSEPNSIETMLRLVRHAIGA